MAESWLTMGEAHERLGPTCHLMGWRTKESLFFLILDTDTKIKIEIYKDEGKDIHRHDNTERDIGGSHTCHGLLYSIVFYWSKFQTNIYSPVLEYS